MFLAVALPQAFGRVLEFHVRNSKRKDTIVLPRRQARQRVANELTFDDIHISVPKGIMDMCSYFADQIAAEEAPHHRAQINSQ